MYIIIWRYLVKAKHIPEFEEIYSPKGAWVKLFQRGKGFLRTELIRDEKRPRRYFTVDEWDSAQAYELFMLQWKNEYAVLDARCAHLTVQEELLGKGETVPPPGSE